ncbi:PREDICTED: phosphoinositide 3-kinase regulatory subunit 4-like [Camelina sativa]|uniref:non-specific serine/threonine protein kinase n=1 Tax=Camelina sativa TaxID=90675 RepID=A0ABM0UAH3_CAMSA|nr:PREDICTED: phosphoinositide 3-kinase regulatory subunit 4-like [Camelina sativa]
MGNKIARTTQVSATEYYLHDLPSSYNLVLKEVLCRGRFLKSIQCKHDEGLVVVKVYFKRGDSIDLRDYERHLVKIKDVFLSLEHPHVWPFQFWQETDKAAYLVRQYFYSNLHDRLSTRPFLNLVEKKWLAFQLLLAVKQCHEKDICHGDIKCENVLLTSWNWLYLADFASFKPTYIPYDDPSDFSFFFDTRGQRLCYLAPERFYEHGGETQVAQDAPLKPSMDIFAVGCVIAELFMEGQPLFELAQLLAYRRGQHDPSQHLEKIPDLGIRKMILHMIQLEPEARLSAEDYLKNYVGVVFPNYFSPFLHTLYCCWNPLPSDMRVATCQGIFQEILKKMMENKPGDEDDVDPPVPSNSVNASKVQETFANHKLNASKVLSSNTVNSKDEILHSISDAVKKNRHPFLKKITMDDLGTLMSLYDSRSDTYGTPFLPVEGNMKCEGMVLIASMLCSCIRNIKLPHLRREAILLLRSCSLYIDDDDRLQRVLPYVVALLSDPTAIVRCAAMETLCDILPLVRDFPPSDAKIFPEYIFPMLSMLPEDTEESVRICYASNIAKLALTAYGFLMHSFQLSDVGVLNELNSQQIPASPPSETPSHLQKANGNAQLAQLRKTIAEVVQELVMGPKQTPNVRRALLQDIGELCFFFGQRQSNDFLLPILPAFLNDRDEQLRSVFFEKIVYVCFFVGQRSVEEYLLPYIDQALSDQTEAVIVNALECLSTLCKSNFLRKRALLQMIECVYPLLRYPSQWVRRAVVTFIAASSECIGAIDSFAFIAPVIRPFLSRLPASIASEEGLLSCLRPQVTREVVYSILEKARKPEIVARQRKIWYSSSPQSKDWETVDLFDKDTGELNSIECGAEQKQNVEGQKQIRSASKQPEVQGKYAEKDVKLRIPRNPRPNVSNNVESRDPLCQEKLQFSGFMAPYVSGLNSYIEPENIPLYSFSMDKRAATNPPVASESSLQMNSLGMGSLSVPWMDSMSKSFNLASSVPVPKLISGSFHVGNNPKQFYRVVHEPDCRENDQISSAISKFQDLGVSSSSKSASVTSEDASSPADLVGEPSLSRTSVPDSGWKPRGVLVAHLQEHRSAVNDIATSSDHSFFVSASDDSTVKVWDSRKLEKDISFRSRLTYHLEGSRGMCTTMLRNSTQIVVGASDGVIHMFSIDHISRGLGNVVEKYSGIVDIKKKDVKEGALVSLLNYTADSLSGPMVMYSTQNCGIHLWDTRSDLDAWTLKANPEEGYVSSLVTSPCGNWFVSGSSRGVLTLWDLRFRVPVNSWQYPLVCPIEKMCLCFLPPSVSVSTTMRPFIYIAAGCNEVSLWNAEAGSCHQVLRVANYENETDVSEFQWKLPSNKVNSKPNLRQNMSSKYRIEELNEPPPRLPGIRTLLPLPGGDLLTGGTDLKIRCWDYSSPERSYSICGPNLKGVGNVDFYELKTNSGVQFVQETKRRPLATKLTAKAVLAAAATDTAGCHRDSVQSLASVKLNQRLLISSSRDGAIKVWK